MFKKIVWPLVLLSSLALLFVFVTGFIASVNISKAPEETTKKPLLSSTSSQEEIETAQDSSEIVILGDSIGFGIGDEENLGIEKRYAELINKEDENKKEITNISVPGFESSDLVNIIKTGENTKVLSKATLIILSIGGNDLNRLEYEDDLTLTLAYEETLKKYQENLVFIVNEIRSVNPDAQLAFIGLYNPYSKDEPEIAKFLLEWNYQTRLIVNRDAKFAYIPTYELFEYHLDDYLSQDDFHPNGAGYQVIVEELDKIIN